LPEAKLDLGAVDVNENSIMYYLDQETGTYKELVTLLTAEDTIWVTYDQIPQKEHIYDATPLKPWFDVMKQELLAIIAEYTDRK
jgi:hypothetical protein